MSNRNHHASVTRRHNFNTQYRNLGYGLLGVFLLFFWKELLALILIFVVSYVLIFCILRFRREIFYGISRLFSWGARGIGILRDKFLHQNNYIDF